MERIVRVAIKYNGVIVIGEEKERHHHVIQRMVNLGIKPPINREQGFITNDGRFVGRLEAYQIAYFAGQIRTKTTEMAPENLLFSEDVW